MKKRSNKKELKYYLIFGILFLVFGIATVIFDSGNIFNYGYLLFGILYLGIYLFETNKKSID